MSPEFELLSPWVIPPSPDTLKKELLNELAPEHQLYGKVVQAVAKAEDWDDVLFEIREGATLRSAIVHLTWTGKPEINPSFPRTRFFDSISEWLEWMRADHADYSSGDTDNQ
jgi:hypothetical protein